jgi:D-alanine transaminase
MIDNPTPSPDAQCFLNGEFQPLASARIGVLDRGFIFGDGVYEVVPVYQRRPFRWPHHFARLDRSLARIELLNPLPSEQWLEIVAGLITRHAWPNQFVYLQVTRGVAKRDHAFPASVTPTIFAMSSPLIAVSAEQLSQGIVAITLDDDRWLNCDIKSISLLGNVLARQTAIRAGAAECLMFRDGMLTEGSSSNIWLVRSGRVIGVPHDRLVLQGIRYDLLEELCGAVGVEFELRRVARDEIFAADELLLTSATKEVLPITRVDGRLIGTGKPGPIHSRLFAAYQRAKAAAATDGFGRS